MYEAKKKLEQEREGDMEVMECLPNPQKKRDFLDIFVHLAKNSLHGTQVGMHRNDMGEICL